MQEMKVVSGAMSRKCCPTSHTFFSPTNVSVMFASSMFLQSLWGTLAATLITSSGLGIQPTLLFLGHMLDPTEKRRSIHPTMYHFNQNPGFGCRRMVPSLGSLSAFWDFLDLPCDTLQHLDCSIQIKSPSRTWLRISVGSWS